MIIYQPKSIQWISINSCNSHNHWINGIKPDHYDAQISLTNKNKWNHLIPNNKSIEYHLSSGECKFLYDIGKIWSFTGYITPIDGLEELKSSNESKTLARQANTFSREIRDFEDLTSLRERIIAVMNPKMEKMFVRLNDCSPKDSNMGPFYNIDEIIYALGTSERINMALEDAKSEVLYISPWNESWVMNYNYEYRVFVCKRKISAISQYHWYKIIDHTNLVQHIELIIEFVTNLIPKIDWVNSYTMDVIVVDNDGVELIELNSFGYLLAAGSCCFHWINDYDILYGVERPTGSSAFGIFDSGAQEISLKSSAMREGNIYIRYVTK